MRQSGLCLEVEAMKKSRFTEEQIAFALRQAESGARAAHIEAQHTPAPGRVESPESSQADDGGGVMRFSANPCERTQTNRMGVTGLEPVTSAM